MKNAFTILGAQPTDDIEKLKELLDEKELLSDDATEAQGAYSDLVNPKKRIYHEIVYYSDETFEKFYNMVGGNLSESPTVGEIAEILVDLGEWFDGDDAELLSKINDGRLISGFAQIDNSSVIVSTIDSIRQDCFSSTLSYFERTIDESTLVKIFNQIVRVPSYESFFIDDLMGQYEIIVGESLNKKEQECITSFDAVESVCKQFLYDGILNSTRLKDNINKFSVVLKDWDNYAQPLQVNMQKRGGQHEESLGLVNEVRNKIIDLCNRSQDAIQQSLNNLEKSKIYAQILTAYNNQFLTQRKILENKLNNSIVLINFLIQLIDLLSQVFAELECTAEQLKSDRNDLVGLRNTLTNLRNQIPGAQQRATEHQWEQLGYNRSNSTSNNSTESSLCGNQKACIVLAVIALIIMIIGFCCNVPTLGWACLIMGIGFIIGCCLHYYFSDAQKVCLVLAVIALIIMTIGFCCNVPALGWACLIIGIGFIIGCCGCNYFSEHKKALGAFIVAVIIVLCCVTIPVANTSNSSSTKRNSTYSGSSSYSSSSNSSNSRTTGQKITLTTSNFETYFTVSVSVSYSNSTAKISYRITPKSSTYASNSNSTTSIDVNVKVGFYSSSTASFATTSKSIYITLSKSSGYESSGTSTLNLSSNNYSYYTKATIQSCSGTIYK
jgi:hypothetical protein